MSLEIEPHSKASALLALQKRRYAVREFNPLLKLSDDVWSVLEMSLWMTPSSYGLQPWKFIVVTDPRLKRELRIHSRNQPQVEDCSHFVVFCARESIDEQDIDKYCQLISTTRELPKSHLEGLKKIIQADLLGFRASRVLEINTFQSYIALGNLMTSAAMLDVDTCPMEGFFPEQYDRALKLRERGYRAVVACAVGYRSAEDKYASAPKIRFPIDQIIERR